ncbi:MAG: GTP-binding protein [Candidatus Hodarchaeales archaeon]|jgi:small GTP-binding protein
MTEETYFLMKIVLIGEGAVGKTALRARYLGQGFDFANYSVTIGADFVIREQDIALPDAPPDEFPTRVKFQIWDIAGQPRFSELRKLYYRGALGALLLFDVSRRSSTETLVNWAREFFHHNGRGALPVILIGNKIDLRAQLPDALSTADGEGLAAELRALPALQDSTAFVKYLETSAKTGENVHEAFQLLGESVLGHVR